MNYQKILEEIEESLCHFTGQMTLSELEETKILEKNILQMRILSKQQLEEDYQEIQAAFESEIVNEYSFLTLSLIQPYHYKAIALKEKLFVFIRNLRNSDYQFPNQSYLSVIELLSNYYNFMFLENQRQDFEEMFQFTLSFQQTLTQLDLYKNQIRIQFLKLIPLIQRIHPGKILIESFIDQTYYMKEINEEFIKMVCSLLKSEKQIIINIQSFQKVIIGTIFRAQLEMESVIANNNPIILQKNKNKREDIIQALQQLIKSASTVERQRIVHQNKQFLSLVIRFSGKFKERDLVLSLIKSLMNKRKFEELQKVVIAQLLNDYNSLIERDSFESLLDNNLFVQYMIGTISSNNFKRNLNQIYLRSETGSSFILKLTTKMIQMGQQSKNIIIELLIQASFLTQIKYFVGFGQIRSKLETIIEIGSDEPHSFFIAEIQKTLENVPDRKDFILQRL